MATIKYKKENGDIIEATYPACCPIPDELQDDFMNGCWGFFLAIEQDNVEEFKKHCDSYHSDEELKRLREANVINENENPKVCDICKTLN